MIPLYHQCDFCNKTFVNENNLKKHNCDFKERYEFITNTASGQSMYELYLYWLRSNGKSVKYVDEHTFIHSIHFKPFKRFINFCKKKSIPDKKIYIKVCNGYNLSPKDWSTEKMYETFLDIYDELIPIHQQVDTSLATLYQLSEGLEVKISQIFQELDPMDVAKLIKRRKISPWLFLNSGKFKEFLIDHANSETRNHIQKTTNPAKWKEIFNKNPSKRKEIHNIIKEIGL